MRLTFFCGSLEPGRDGVGDYTRRLAGECIRLGHPSLIVALNDPRVSEVQNGPQQIERTSIPVWRLPSLMPWNERMAQARAGVESFKPDWASLQFVPFAFNRKGICFGLSKTLAGVNTNASWHIMFHELWLGLGEKAPFKDRVYGVFQRRAVLDLAGQLQPRIVHTQAEPYRRVLARERIHASILPLFGNIPYGSGDGWKEVLEPLVTEAIGTHCDRAGLHLAGVLGGVHPEWNGELAVDTLLPLVQRFQKRLILVFIGKNNLTPDTFKHLKSKLQNRAVIVQTGGRTDLEISKILQALDFGLATSPRQIIQKSGSVAAMLEHGLKILVTRDDWRLRESNPPPDAPITGLLSTSEFARLERLPIRDPSPTEGNSVARVAERLLSRMNSTVSKNQATLPCGS